ncbi:hypothetical protein NM688_g4271 [Phlebia brevispora]|uniref:Uncharacterized protein n=1 Tax=Phlebia brevispora TaxID=194682 RepID=A0ACC1T3S8_9APHY|nr:hypothetical protein NM688_g4271 [Phlebia brevispora]
MPKRASSSTPSTPRKRKARVVDDQSNLDAYFRKAGGGPVAGTPGSPAKVMSDEELARKLAEEEGWDIQTLRDTELVAPERHKAKAKHDVIDVDLLDDMQTPGAGSSNSVPRNVTEDGSSPAKRNVSLARGTLGATASLELPKYSSLFVDPLEYDVDASPWSDKIAAPYSFLAHTLSTLSGTKSRIAILNTLTNALRTIIQYHAASLCPSLYLLSNALTPPYSPLELGLGPSLISKAIQDVSGLTPAALKRLYNATGDPGDVAFEAKSNVRTLFPHPPLLITGVYDALLKIANAKGSGAGKQKQSIVEKLLVSAKGEEVRYLVRTLGQNLRVGAVRTSILTALARAVVLTPPANSEVPQDPSFYASPELLARIKPLSSKTKQKAVDSARDELQALFSQAEGIIKKVYVQHPNYDHIAAALLEGGLKGLANRLPLTVGIPLLPTLGSPMRSLDEIYERLGELSFSAEFKYDGQRAQIHGAREQGSKPFDVQELSNRARRDVKLDDVTVSVCVFAFDLMYLNGEILLERPFRHRRSLLRTRFPPHIPGVKGAARFDHVQSCESEAGREAVEEFWQTAVNSRSEGLMVKLLDSGEITESTEKTAKTRRKPLPATYEPGKSLSSNCRRTSAWLKLKKDYVHGLGDSLDLVPIGAWHGNGRKAQWWSPILLAVWDPDIGKLVAVCKCMSGFSDAFYKARCPYHSVNHPLSTCSRKPTWDPECETGGLRPEVYFKPQEVWEIRGADVTISPVSVAAIGRVSDEKGLSLRFPRFMRVREDKTIGTASTPEFLANMYRSQQQRGEERAGVDDGELVDVSMEEESEVEELESGMLQNPSSAILAFATMLWLCLTSSLSVYAEETVQDAGEHYSPISLAPECTQTMPYAARIARRLVDFSDGIGNMATVYPDDDPTLAGTPAIVTARILWQLSREWFSDTVIHADFQTQARVSLMGNVTIFQELDSTPERDAIQFCYLSRHPDAHRWVPGPREPHIAYWARFDPHSVYFVGGFGSSHYIGYIPLEMYRSAAPIQSTAGRILVEQESR